MIFVVRTSVATSTPAAQVYAALTAQGALSFIESPYDLDRRSAAVEGGVLQWQLQGKTLSSPIVVSRQDLIQWRDKRNQFVGQIKIQPGDVPGRVLVDCEAQFPMKGGGLTRIPQQASALG